VNTSIIDKVTAGGIVAVAFAALVVLWSPRLERVAMAAARTPAPASVVLSAPLSGGCPFSAPAPAPAAPPGDIAASPEGIWL
jgi:hypothetical protein